MAVVTFKREGGVLVLEIPAGVRVRYENLSLSGPGRSSVPGNPLEELRRANPDVEFREDGARVDE